MKTEIVNKGIFAALKVELEPEETIKTESGAMVSMDSHIEISGKSEGGLLGGLGRILAGDTFFLQKLIQKSHVSQIQMTKIKEWPCQLFAIIAFFCFLTILLLFLLMQKQKVK